MHETLPWQKRLLTERQRLDAKLRKLDVFLNTPRKPHMEGGIDKHDIHLLNEQRKAMSKYLHILTLRIERFEKEKVNV
jgi:hypothetical protein